jgi:hypothetical protein
LRGSGGGDGRDGMAVNMVGMVGCYALILFVRESRSTENRDRLEKSD